MFLEKIENSSLGALVLHMTSNVTISRRCQHDNGKEMYQSVKRCRWRVCLSMGIRFPPTTVPLTIFVFLFDCLC